MKKRKFSRWILLLCCLFIPAFTAGAKAPLGTPTREVLLDMAWDCLEEYHFSCIRTNAVAVSKATQIMSEKEEQTETQQVETEQQTEEQSSETSFDVTQYIFVGDSRTVGMHETVGDSGCVWIGQVSAGLSWFQDTAVGEIDESVTQGSVIIINMGVNDLGNAWGYIDLLKEKIPQWMEKGAEVYYMSVNPVENHPYISNEDIANFNNILYNNLPSETGWIETNSYLLESGYSTQDGVHFDAETYQKIFNYTMEVLSGFGRQ